MHQIFDLYQQTAAERAARMGTGEILSAEVACLEHRNRERITHRKCRSGACGRRKIMRTGFALNADIKADPGSRCN